MNRKSDAVDIIIPIYNGYEDLQRCIPSVKKHTDLSRNRVVLIDDCSPDERIAPYLDSLEEEHILVIHNEKNLGFSGNVNKGMSLSEDRDVILLNSDTVVTAGWVEKLTACAYREESIGTVTPLSNSATLCSVPVMCQDNPVPENVTIDEYAALIERCSLKRYPRITVAVGFCMYIKRCVIDDIGCFDAETFQRGYGEENDFCNRAEQAGYHQVMCDDTFIYHKGTASFDTAQKQALLEAHTAVLEQRYPEQMRRNHLYCMENPDQEIRDNIKMYTKLHNGKKNLLYLLHLDFREHAFNNIGGTQIHVRELMESFRKDYNVFVAARDEEDLCVTAYTDTDEITLKFEIGEAPQFPAFRDSSLRKIYEQVLMAFDIDLVHVQHSQDLSLEIYEAAKKLGIPVIATLHDYYYVCPTILLLDTENRFCGETAGDCGASGTKSGSNAGDCGASGSKSGLNVGDCGASGVKSSLKEEDGTRMEKGTAKAADFVDPGSECAGCRECLWKKKGVVPQVDYLRIWRREHERALRRCEKLIFPTESAKEIVLSYYPGLRDKCMAIYHGEDRTERQVVHRDVPAGAKRNGDLKVKLDRVVGADQGLNDIKGWAYLQGIPNDQTEIYVELTDSRGAKDCFLAPKAARPDIVDAFGDPDALMCGIDLRISTEKLADGPVKIQVYVKAQGEVFTDGKTYKGNYRRRFGKPGRLNVAFLGGMVPQKGSTMARALIPMDQKEINWFVLGAIGDKKIMEIRQDNCFFSSTYKKEELPQLLRDNEIDVVCILPIWPETFCYTVSEAWMNGIPVVGTDIGAVGERIRATGGGWLLPPDVKPEEALKLLHRIKEHPEEYQEKKQIVDQMKHKSVEEMCGEYRTLYRSILADSGEKCLKGEIDFDFIFQGLALGDPSVSGRGGVASMNRLRNENAALKASIEVMKGTTSYRLARKLADANIPFKEQLKKALRRG